jgi:hypothetical protein
MKKRHYLHVFATGSVQYVLNVLFTFSIIKGFYKPISQFYFYSISEWVVDQICGVYTSKLIDKLYYDYWQIANKNIQYVWPLKLSYR